MKISPPPAWFLAAFWLLAAFLLVTKVAEWATNAAEKLDRSHTDRQLTGIMALLGVIAVAQIYQCRPWELFTKKRDGS